MGKNLRQQRRGRGGSQYRSPSHRHLGDIKLPKVNDGAGKIVDITHAPGRTGPLAEVDFAGDVVRMIAAEGMYVGQDVYVGGSGAIVSGNVMPLARIPDGTLIYNTES